jgi:hypothetical protein
VVTPLLPFCQSFIMNGAGLYGGVAQHVHAGGGVEQDLFALRAFRMELFGRPGCFPQGILQWGAKLNSGHDKADAGSGRRMKHGSYQRGSGCT